MTTPGVSAKPALSAPARENELARTKTRSRSAWRLALRDPTTIIGILASVLFAYLIVVPVISMLSDAILVQIGEERRAHASVGMPTLYYLARTFNSAVSSDLFWQPLVHPLEVAAGAIILAVTIGATMAWLLSRTDMLARRWLATALIVPYMLPAWTFALAWTTLFKNRTIGGQLGWLEAVGVSPPDWLAYGQVPITIIMALHYAPFVILLFGNALRRFDSQLEDSARVLGAGTAMVTAKLIVPLMLPSLLSAVILIFAKSVGR